MNVLVLIIRGLSLEILYYGAFVSFGMISDGAIGFGVVWLAAPQPCFNSTETVLVYLQCFDWLVSLFHQHREWPSTNNDPIPVATT